MKKHVVFADYLLIHVNTNGSQLWTDFLLTLESSLGNVKLRDRSTMTWVAIFNLDCKFILVDNIRTLLNEKDAPWTLSSLSQAMTLASKHLVSLSFSTGRFEIIHACVFTVGRS